MNFMLTAASTVTSFSIVLSHGCASAGNYTIKETAAILLYSSPNGSAGAVSGDGEFVVLGLPVFLRRLNTSFDI